ncbi:MAG: GHMP kinase [Deltaproteobacteria bacterium]|nr:GHMP kinase [Deltaproteobacteria bacterium]MBW2413317.1 GHMP kinase [Deltaproteobacteria bacterium]
MKPVRGTAFARAGLLGNPSDQYAGRAIALTFRDFGASVALEPAERFEIVPGAADETCADDARDAVARLREEGCHGGVRLLQATLLRFAGASGRFGALAQDDPRLRFRMRYESDVPRQAGLSGSSAIIIAGLRALAAWFQEDLAAERIAQIALAAEVEDLGIQAGPMDRVIQSWEGVLFMDFAGPDGERSRLDPGLLPALYVAWSPRPGLDSGLVHSDVRARWLAGDPQVREAIAAFPALADEGRECLERGDVERLCALVDRNFDMRASIYKLGRADHEMVALGRDHGAAVKLCGSGGSVLGVMPDASVWPRLERAYADAGYRALRPQVG